MAQNVYNILVKHSIYLMFENLQVADYVGVYIVRIECSR